MGGGFADLVSSSALRQAAVNGRIDDEVLERLSNAMVPASSGSRTLESVEGEIEVLRRALARSLALADSIREGRLCRDGLTKDVLKDFLKAWPCASLHSCDGAVRLATHRQCVAFHVNRDDRVPNNGIVYVTMPAHGFCVSFADGGGVHVGVTVSSMETFVKAAAGSDGGWGHPNATVDNGNSLFSSVCTGNNRFMDDYKSFRSEPSVEKWLLCLNDAMEWMTNANLSDMYGTPLWRNVRLADFHSSSDARARTQELLSMVQTAYDPEGARTALRVLGDIMPGEDVLARTSRFICTAADSYNGEWISPPALSLLRRYLMAAWLVARPEILDEAFSGHRTRCLMSAVRNDVALVEALADSGSLIFELERMRPELERTEAAVAGSMKTLSWRSGIRALNDHPMVREN